MITLELTSADDLSAIVDVLADASEDELEASRQEGLDEALVQTHKELSERNGRLARELAAQL